MKKCTSLTARIMALVIGIGALWVGDALGGEIYIKNNSATSGLFKSELYLRNIDDALEGYESHDTDYLSPPYSNGLTIYTLVDGNKLSTDSHPVKTKCWDIYLGIKGTVTGDNYLRYLVSNITDLADPYQINVYDTLIPTIKTTLLKDGAFHNITGLPSLVDESQNPYAYWRADLDVVVGAGQTYTLDSVIAANTIVGGNLTTTTIDSTNVNVYGTGVLTATSITADTLSIGGTGTASSIPEPGVLVLLAMAGVVGLAGMRKIR